MRTKKEYKRVCLTKEVYNRLIEDRSHFQETVKGGRWSLSDTIMEYHKIISLLRGEREYALDHSDKLEKTKGEKK